MQRHHDLAGMIRLSCDDQDASEEKGFTITELTAKMVQSSESFKISYTKE